MQIKKIFQNLYFFNRQIQNIT